MLSKFPSFPRKLLNLTLALTLVVAALPAGARPTQATTLELFFSEYIEGSSNNKALEIYNDTGNAINLVTDSYNVQMYFNGSASAGLTINLTGTVANGDVYVVAQSAANATILAQADQTSGAGWFNGDDAVVLRKGTTVIDVIGQIGFDPGTEWGAGLTSTADNTLRRKATICQGDPDGSNIFDPAPEWDGFAIDTFGGLGSHTATCGGDIAPTVDSTIPINGATNLALSTNLTVNFSEPVNVSGAWFDINCTLSGAHPATVTGGPQSFTLDPDFDFVNGDSCTATVFASQVADQDVIDPPDVMAANHVWNFSTPSCGAPATFIHDIQGNGLTSPMNGATNVTIEGIVVGDYQGAGQFSGFHVQEEDADADANPATSEGVFVFNTSFAVNAGDKVRLKGNVLEFSTSDVFLTELTSVTGVEVCSTGHSVTPAVVNLPVSNLNDWEAYEGMLVSLPQNFTVTENFTLGRFGEVSLSVDGRLFNPTSVTTPGAAAIALQDLNNRRRIVLDDGNNQQNIDPTFYPAGGLSAANTLRSGDSVNGLTGVLEQRFGVYRVQPVGAVNFSATNARTLVPDNVGGSLQVASMNVLNYFNGNGLGGGFPTPRGATSAFEFTRQRTKIINAIVALNADIVGLMELENDAAPNSAIQDLVAGLNAAAGAGAYSFIDTGIVGTDEIRVGLLYKPASVTPVGAFAILDSSVDPLFLDTKNRPVLAQTFAQNANGQQFTVAVNHLKSKGSDCNDVGDPDIGDGQGNCNLTRTDAATALVNWLATDPTSSGDPDFLIIGDLNSYAMEDPITTIVNGGYTNLLEAYLGSTAYSFVFQAQSGYLDHALSNATFTPQVTGATEWHINADEPIVLDYNTEFKSANHVNTLYATTPYRSSDHDPVLVGVCQAPTASASVTPNVLWPPNHKYRTIQATVTASADVSTIALVSVTSDEPDSGLNAEDVPNDIVIVDNDTFKLRAERFDEGDGRVYTITYQVTNTCGQSIVITTTVTVPHDQGS